MTLTTLDILYITLSIFTWVIGTLLAIVLIKVIKILWPIQEIVWYYETVKWYISMYAQIPWMVKDYIFDLLTKNKQKVVKEDEIQEKKV
jgi:hypothetical protein